MVALINKTTHPKHSNVFGGGLSRALHQLPRDFDAQTKVAPSLCAVIRGFMEGKQISAEAIQSFLDQNKSMGRYDPSFRKLWVLMKAQGVAPQCATLSQVASAIITLHHFSPSQAKNAYRGMLLVPGFSALRFEPLLGPFKKLWNSSTQKYGTFWEPAELIQQLATTPLSGTPLDLRERLLISLRLLCLYRGIDLARLQRTISLVGNRPFVMVQRKGWAQPKWEEIISLPRLENISPWHLLQAYVARTSEMGTPGVFFSTYPPINLCQQTGWLV